MNTESEFTLYLPFREVFRICRFHQDFYLHPDGSFVCMHPSVIGAKDFNRKCTSSCPAREEIAKNIAITQAKYIDAKELQNSQLLFDFAT